VVLSHIQSPSKSYLIIFFASKSGLFESTFALVVKVTSSHTPTSVLLAVKVTIGTSILLSHNHHVLQGGIKNVGQKPIISSLNCSHQSLSIILTPNTISPAHRAGSLVGILK
jgi:hypothetical protein